jgi:hypothetical protein
MSLPNLQVFENTKAPQVGLEPTTLRLTVAAVPASYDCDGLLQTTTGVSFSPPVHPGRLLRITMFDGQFLGTLGTKMGTVLWRSQIIVRLRNGPPFSCATNGST